jgi:hypothetical protein
MHEPGRDSEEDGCDGHGIATVSLPAEMTLGSIPSSRPRKKHVHPSLPGRYRALKRRQQVIKLGLGFAITTSTLLGAALVYVTTTDWLEIRVLTREVQQLEYELRETLRASEQTAPADSSAEVSEDHGRPDLG